MRPEAKEILRECNNWQDFKSRLDPLASDPETSRFAGYCFEVLTLYYLELSYKYQQLLKNVWLLDDVPTTVLEKVGLERKDEGIDLVAEAKDGEFWAIQCKYRMDATQPVIRPDLGTFLDLLHRSECKLGLVCTTAESISKKLKIREGIASILGDVWQSLDEEFFRRLADFLDKNEKEPPEPYKPYPHQQQALENARTHFLKESNTRGKLIMACGTGKSLTGYWLAEQLKAQTILLAVPSLNLVRQTLDTWARESLANNRDYDWIVVCSDKSVDKATKKDSSVVVQDLGVRVHTDPGEIASWLKKSKDRPTLVLTTYQSGKVTAEAVQEAGMEFDLAIFDEAHKTTGKKGSLFSHLLYEANIKIKRRIFMTATERHYRGSSDRMASMDDPDLYGETFEQLSFKQAIEASPPLLSDYRILILTVTHDEVAALIDKNLFVRPDKGKWDDDIEARILTSVVALRKAIREYKIRHSMSFHSTISRAKAFWEAQDSFGEAFPEYGKLDNFHVSSRKSTAERSRQLERFEASQNSLITNARCLTEGVDIPAVDCVLFADPKQSTIDIVQAVGRGLRLAKNKELCYVVVPVLLHQSEDRRAVEAYKSILSLLRSLAAHDERIVEEFRSISAGKRPGKPIVSWSGLPDLVTDGRDIDLKDFQNSIELKIYPQLARLEWRPFEEARAFVHTLELKSNKEWRAYSRGDMPEKGTRPADIPYSPENVYKDKGWLSYLDWLGKELVEWRPFEEARAFVHTLELKSYKEWLAYAQGDMPEKGTRPADIPSSPSRLYKDKGWLSFPDWLGYELVEWRPFEEARAFVHTLELKGTREWKAFSRGDMPEKGERPADIPGGPQKVYKDKGWNGIRDWLGQELVEWRPLEEARAFVQTLELKSKKEWQAYSRGDMPEKGTRPPDIPSNPERVYKDKGWISWPDWLGTSKASDK